MHHHPPLPLVHFAIQQSIGHHPVSYNARRMDEAQPRWLGLPRDLGTDQVSCLPATAHRGTTQGFPSRVHQVASFLPVTQVTEPTAWQRTVWCEAEASSPYFR